jgi:4,5-dihydroxyphthalate decarboxylase
VRKLSLAYASAYDYDRTRALSDGTVQPDGIDLNFMVLPTIEETFWRVARYQDFGSSEFSLHSYIVSKADNIDRQLPLTAIPVFPSRMFRHSAIYVNVRAGIEKPEDLKNKVVGVPEYQITAATWVRGILQHEYGVHPEDIRKWRTGGLEQQGRVERLSLNLPKHVHVEPIAESDTLNSMLDRGELDALVTARMPSCFYKGSSNVRRLFEDYASIEQDYFERTHIFPIMHTVVIRRDIYESNSWIARNLYRAFDEAKAFALDRAYETGALQFTMPWMIPAIEKQRSVFGEDPWPYGVEANIKPLEALTQYSYEQGLSKRRVTIEELFAPETIGGSRI